MSSSGPEDGGDQGRRQAADERHDDGDQEEEEHVADEVELVAEGHQGHGQQRRQHDGQDVAANLASAAEAAAPVREGDAPAGVAVGDDVDVDVAGGADRVGGGAGAEQPGPGGPAALAEHELGGVLGAGEGEQGLGDVVAEQLVVGAAERLDEQALRGECLMAGAGEAVGPGDVHGEQVAAGCPGGDPGGAADQGLALGAAGQRDDDPLAGLPGAGDVVLLAVLLQGVVDPVGGPQQGQLAQGVEVAGPEVVRQRGVDLLGGVDVAVRQAPAQRLGGHVLQLDLVGRADDGVRDRLSLRYAGDLLDHVVDRLQVLDVDGRDDVDAGGQELLDVLPAFGVAAAGDVGVGELVDQRHPRAPGQDGVDVHLGERGAPIGDGAAGDDLEPGDHLLGVLAAVGLHEPDHHVGAAFDAAVSLTEHGVGLAHPRRCSEVDPELPAGTHVL